MRLWSPCIGLPLGLAGLTAVLAGLVVFCAEPKRDTETPPEAAPAGATPSQDAGAEKRSPGKAILPKESPAQTRARQRMVDRHLRGRDISDARVLEVMGRLPRHEFVPHDQRELAYADHPLPIGHGQTISQPYIVALMTQLARPKSTHRALDIGTGSGYQAAVLAELCKEVYSIEIVEPLATSAHERLKRLGYQNVTVRAGDGYRGWPEKAPFDVIIVAAAPSRVPKPLVEQLAPGGRLVIPVGDYFQELLVLEKRPDGSVREESGIPVRFVPMTGEAQRAK